MRPTCTIEGCDKTHHARGLCGTHYSRLLTTGTVDDRARPSVMERVNARIRIDDNGCWLWTGATASGYGVMRVNGRQDSVHRITYEELVGPIPDGLHIDHLCRVRACCNPAHLEPVTCRENLLRGEGPSAIAARKTHCVNGHEFTPENTYVKTTTGARSCRECTCAAVRARYWRDKEAG